MKRVFCFNFTTTFAICMMAFIVLNGCEQQNNSGSEFDNIDLDDPAKSGKIEFVGVPSECNIAIQVNLQLLDDELEWRSFLRDNAQDENVQQLQQLLGPLFEEIIKAERGELAIYDLENLDENESPNVFGIAQGPFENLKDKIVARAKKDQIELQTKTIDGKQSIQLVTAQRDGNPILTFPNDKTVVAGTEEQLISDWLGMDRTHVKHLL